MSLSWRTQRAHKAAALLLAFVGYAAGWIVKLWTLLLLLPLSCWLPVCVGEGGQAGRAIRDA